MVKINRIQLEALNESTDIKNIKSECQYITIIDNVIFTTDTANLTLIDIDIQANKVSFIYGELVTEALKIKRATSFILSNNSITSYDKDNKEIMRYSKDDDLSRLVPIDYKGILSNKDDIKILGEFKNIKVLEAHLLINDIELKKAYKANIQDGTVSIGKKNILVTKAKDNITVLSVIKDRL